MICQSSLPICPWLDPVMSRLPGISPIGAEDWIVRDDAFDAQMQLADRLIEARRDDVAALRSNDASAEELLALILQNLSTQEGYRFDGHSVTRLDGVCVDLRSDHPLIIARRLVQEDLLIHVKDGDEHVLDSGVLCFPASWTLAEKVSNGLKRVHAPVREYTPDLARRVQRLFDGIAVGRPLMRANWHMYEAPDLFHPRREAEDRPTEEPAFMRVERQCLLRLPKTSAVVFTIHTYVVPLSQLTASQLAAIPDQH